MHRGEVVRNLFRDRSNIPFSKREPTVSTYNNLSFVCTSKVIIDYLISFMVYFHVRFMMSARLHNIIISATTIPITILYLLYYRCKKNLCHTNRFPKYT